jgi:hypothetical protein
MLCKIFAAMADILFVYREVALFQLAMAAQEAASPVAILSLEE